MINHERLARLIAELTALARVWEGSEPLPWDLFATEEDYLEHVAFLEGRRSAGRRLQESLDALFDGSG